MPKTPTTRTCPVCGGTALPLVIGMPGPDLAEAAGRGEVILGGCVMDDGSIPTWQCRDCEHAYCPQVLYVDLDNTLVDFGTRLEGIDPSVREQFDDRADEIPGIFALMPPMPGAIEAFRKLAAVYDTYILSTAPWGNPTAWTDKLSWVQLHFGFGDDSPAYKRLILSHNKNLNVGDYLIDDRPNNGAEDFNGEWLHFGTEDYPDWDAVLRELLSHGRTEL